MKEYGNYDDPEGDVYDIADESEEEKKKKKGGKGEIDSQGREQPPVTDGFYAYMNSIGASKSLVSEILGSWKHLTGEALMRVLKTFVSRIASRATAHVEVEIDKNKDYGILHNIIKYFKGAPQSPGQKQGLDQSNTGPK